MGSRRTLITIAAIAVGAFAVFLIYGYTTSVKDEAFGEAERIKVFTVQQPVVKGTYGEEANQGALIVEDEIPKRFWPENAIRSFDDIAGKVAVGDLAVNQIVTTDMFAEPSTVQSTFSDRLEKINDDQQVAITIQIDQVRGVAGLLQPGDFVNIMATNLCPLGSVDGTDGFGEDGSGTGAEENEGAGSEEEAAPSGSGCESPVFLREQARYIYQKVQILAIDQTPVQLPGDAQAAAAEGAEGAAPTVSSGLITLIVPAEAAQVVASIDPSRFYLTLVSRDYIPEPQEGVDWTQPLPAEDPSKLTPYGPEGPGGE